MSNQKQFAIALLSLLSIFISYAKSQNLPEKNEIISILKLVNNYWISQNSDPGNNQWARSAYFTGNMDFYNIYPKESYLNYTRQWAQDNSWALDGGITTRNADNQICGQVYIDLYNLESTKDNNKIFAIKSSVDNMVNSDKIDDWWWIDALYMSMPVFAKIGALYNDSAYFEKMYALYQDTKTTRGLYNKTFVVQRFIFCTFLYHPER